MSKLRILDLFSGIGGFSLGLERTGGFETVAFCEIDPFARRVLAKHWPEVPCYDDVRALTADRLSADGISVDAICGGFPCQDISVAGDGAGLDGARSGLWFEYLRLIGELRPRYVIVENVAALVNGGLDRVLGSLSTIGYDAEWQVVSAAAIGAPHLRERVWIIAYPNGQGWQGSQPILGPSQRAASPFTKSGDPFAYARGALAGRGAGVRSGDGVPLAVDRLRLRALGNAVVPQIPEAIGRAILRAAA